METAQDINTQLRSLVGSSAQTSIGKVTIREAGDGFEVNVHQILEDGNLNTTLSVGRNGRVIESQTLKSSFEEVSASGQTSFGALSMGYSDPVVSEAKYSLRDVLSAVTEARRA